MSCFRAEDWDFIYTETGEDTYDLMIYNPVRKELFLEEDVGAELLRGVDSFGKPYAAVKLSNESFYEFFDMLCRWGEQGGYCGCFFETDETEETPRIKEKKIPRETVWAALRGELSEEELAAVSQKPMARGDYYDFDMLLAGIHRFMAGEVSKEYYRDWVILVAWALSAHPFEENSKRGLLYEGLADSFDGHSFDNMEGEKDMEICEMIARLKCFNHERMHLRKSELPPFCDDEGVAVYVNFSHGNQNNTFYNVCVVDTAKKRFHLGQVVNPDYREDVNYTFVNAGDFNDLLSIYYEFFHDRSIDLCHYLPERYYLDQSGHPIK
jgi:hypothetical protein